MSTILFRILEQHDGRYIVVLVPDVNDRRGQRAETLVDFEADCRNTFNAYGAVANWMVETGEIFDRTSTIEYVRFPVQS